MIVILLFYGYNQVEQRLSPGRNKDGSHMELQRKASVVFNAAVYFTYCHIKQNIYFSLAWPGNFMSTVLDPEFTTQTSVWQGEGALAPHHTMESGSACGAVIHHPLSNEWTLSGSEQY